MRLKICLRVFCSFIKNYKKDLRKNNIHINYKTKQKIIVLFYSSGNSKLSAALNSESSFEP